MINDIILKFGNTGTDDYRIVHENEVYDKPVTYTGEDFQGDITKIIKRCDPETFEYKNISTSITFYKTYQYNKKSKHKYGRIYISTSDDSSMDLVTEPYNDLKLNQFVNYFKNRDVLIGCEEEYNLFAQYFGYPSSDEIFNEQKRNGGFQLSTGFIRDLGFN